MNEEKKKEAERGLARHREPISRNGSALVARQSPSLITRERHTAGN